jgi:hypothetical protein
MQNFLANFGYIKPSASNAYVKEDDANFLQAIKDMQLFANLPVTGIGLLSVEFRG